MLRLASDDGNLTEAEQTWPETGKWQVACVVERWNQRRQHNSEQQMEVLQGSAGQKSVQPCKRCRLVDGDSVMGPVHMFEEN